MEKVSAIVICFNRAKEIEACLKSIRWVDELIVVDSRSTDRTAEIAQKYADKFYQHEYTSCGAKRNWALRHASHPWVLVIDSDEVMPEPLRDEIREVLGNPAYDQYKAYRRNFFLGREMKHGGWEKDKIIVLFRREKYRYREDVVHDRLIPEDRFGFFKNKVVHSSHNSLDEFIGRSNRYAKGGAAKLFREGKIGKAGKAFSHAAFTFIKQYIFRRGFLDGPHGLIAAVLSSCYVAEKYALLWELGEEKKRMELGC